MSMMKISLECGHSYDIPYSTDSRNTVSFELLRVLELRLECAKCGMVVEILGASSHYVDYVYTVEATDKHEKISAFTAEKVRLENI